MDSQTNTSGGAYIDGNVSVGEKLVGRDNYTFNIITADSKELVQSLLSLPIKNRRDLWMSELGQVVANLHEHTGATLEELQGDDVFIDTVLRASQLALKTSQREKREALRNAITNSALPDALDEILQQRFLNLIDEFSPWHLRVLKLFSGSEKITLTAYDDVERLMNGGAETFVERIYPEVGNYMNILLRDLKNHGLLNDEEGFSWRIENGDKVPVPKWITELGEQFLMFIESPF